MRAWLAWAGGIVMAVLATLLMGRRQGQQAERARQAQKGLQELRAGLQAGQQARLDPRSPDEIVRGNDGAWQ